MAKQSNPSSAEQIYLDLSNYNVTDYLRNTLEEQLRDKYRDQLKPKDNSEQARRIKKETEKRISEEIEEQVKERERLIKLQLQENKYAQASMQMKRDMKKQEAEAYRLAMERNQAALDTVQNEQERLALLSERAELEERYNKALEITQKLNDEIMRTDLENLSVKEQQSILEERATKAKEIHLKYTKEIQKAEKEGNKKEVEKLKTKLKQELTESNLQDYDAEGNRIKKSERGRFSEAISAGFEKLTSGGKLGSAVSAFSKSLLPGISSALGPVTAILGTIANIAGSINRTLDKGVAEAASMQNQYLGKINARLQGGTESYQDFTEYMQQTLGFGGRGGDFSVVSAFISQKKLMENIATLVDKGINFNVEERAMLMTLGDKMVTTFDVLNPTLTRLARIQQADLTSSQMGYEALLTRFLNSYFEDTSYLSDVYDNVADTLLDASSQLTAQASSEFNFAVQKWLASLYSVGMSSSGVSKIAQGVSYLATGNVDALNSDDALRTLFASAAGSGYSNILTGGLNAATVNELLGNVVKYLQSIAGDTNQVTKRAMAGVFGGFDLSDLRAVTNLDTEMFNVVLEKMPTYADSIGELGNQLNAAVRYNESGYEDSKWDVRSSMPGMYDTIFENIVTSYGLDLVSNNGRYATWKTADLISQTGGLGKAIGDIAKVGESLWNSFKGLFTTGEGDERKDASIFDVISSAWKTISSGDDKSAWINDFISTDFYRNVTSGEMVTRGLIPNYASLASGNTIQGLSQSSKLGVTNVSSMADLSTTAAATATKSTISSTETTKDITALYTELFERQTTAMKVSLSSIDASAASTLSNVIVNNIPQTTQINGVTDSVLSALAATMHVDSVDDINNKLSNTLEVSISDNFLNEINNGLSYARGI